MHSYETLPMCALNLRTIGTTPPKELLGKHRVAAGNTVYVTEAPDGSFRLTPDNPAFAEQMDIAEQIMREDHDVLHELAK
jgi:hypothetical protein